MTTELQAPAIVQHVRTIKRIRAFEEKSISLFQDGIVPGFTHVVHRPGGGRGRHVPPAGATTIGSLRNHRGHGHIIAKGADPRRMLAEILGKVEGYCRGMGGELHIMDEKIGDPRRQRDRRRRHPDRHRRGAGRPTRRQRQGDALLLRRRRHQRGRISTRGSTWPRSGGYRSSSSARTTTTASSPPAADVVAGRIVDRAIGYRHPGRERRRPGRGRRQRGRSRRRSSAPAAARVRL